MRIALIAGILLFAGACKKKAPDEAVPQPVSRIDSDLQLVLVTPGQIGVDTPTPLQVVGNGFASGAEVRLGESWVSGVQFDNANTLRLTTPALADGAYDVTVQNPDGGSATLWAGLIVGTGGRVGASAQVCGSVVVYFELDQAGLAQRALDDLGAEAPCWLQASEKLLVEGHADERGTTDYNLALGERRADAVRRNLVRAGLAESRLRVVSWGEERPVDTEHTERAWAANRRAEVHPLR